MWIEIKASKECQTDFLFNLDHVLYVIRDKNGDTVFSFNTPDGIETQRVQSSTLYDEIVKMTQNTKIVL